MGLLHSTMLTETKVISPDLHWLLKLQLPGGNKFYSMGEVSSASQGSAQGKILSITPLVRGFSIVSSALEHTECEVEISDTDREFSKILEGSSGNDVRNSLATIYLASNNVSQSNWFTAWDGRIDAVRQTDPMKWAIIIRPNDLPFARWAPKQPITQGDFPNASADAWGLFAPIIYGTHDSNGLTNEGAVPCYYIDSVNYSYLVAYGWIKDVKAVYADTGSGMTKLSSAVWTRSDVERNGKRFTLIDFSSDTYDDVPVRADVDGIEATGDGTGALLTDPSDQIKHFLVNFIWGDYKTGNYFADGTAPISTTHFATMKTLFVALGYEGAGYIAGEQRKAIDAFNEWLDCWNARAFWLNSGNLAVRSFDHTKKTVYIDAPWLRGDRADLGAFKLEESADVIDRVQVQYLPLAASGQFHQTLEVRDPDLDEDSAESLQQWWSAARLV